MYIFYNVIINKFIYVHIYLHVHLMMKVCRVCLYTWDIEIKRGNKLERVQLMEKGKH